jgi:hypothetical protein
VPSDGVLTNVAPGAGGVERDPLTIHAHLMGGASSVTLLQNTVLMTVTAQAGVNTLAVTVTLANVGAGHHVPTDHPGRHMLLVISATDSAGQPLPHLGGDVIPEWGGDQAGLPGTAYAKVLQDVASGAAPVVSYWKQATILSDNRLPAFGSDTAEVIFAVPPAGGPVTITAELRFRRTFAYVMAAKGWAEPDVLMEREQLVRISPPWWAIYFPQIQAAVQP